MEDTRQFFECEECDGEFTVDTDVGMKIAFCCFCGEPLPDLGWEFDRPLEEPEEM